MKSILYLAILVAAASGAAVVYTGTVRTYVLNSFNNLRSKMALGNQRWHNYTADYDYEWGGGPKPPVVMYPKAKKMFQLQWNATLATAAATRLNGLSGNQLGGSVPSNIGEITHGVLYGIAPNALNPKQMFDAAWSAAWGAWFDSFGFPKMPYTTSDNNYQNFAYQTVAGNANQIGCAYLNITASNQYATVCQFYPKGLAVNVAVYTTGQPIGASCPATAPVNAAKGLCVIQASG